MKISYKVLKRYIQDLNSPEEIAKDLVTHTAEVEDIVYEGENLKDVFIGEVKTCKKHPDSEKLNCTTVQVNGKILSIVCGALNVKSGQKVPVALVGAKLKDDFIISKVKIRGENSEGMICSKDELGLVKERQEGILELPAEAPLNMNFREYLGKNDVILEIDNKAINHRPDMFSHIGVAREIQAIRGKKLNYEYVKKDFSKLVEYGVVNEITGVVSRYMLIKVDNVSNIKSPDYIKEVLTSAGVDSKGLLIDVSNYSLYLYGQPIHCFDADKIKGQFSVRYAKKGEKFIALNGVEYTLSNEDIVLADDKKILCLGGIIGGKESSVTDSTKSILIESAHFDQAILRKTGKRLGIRTDALNLYEKDLIEEMQYHGASLVVDELEKNLKGIKMISYSDVYPKKQNQVEIDFDLDYINKLIGKKYDKKDVVELLSNLGMEISGNKILIPFWRKDLNFKADIAEEIARIKGYNSIESTLPELETKAVVQDNIYKLKNDSRNFFTSIGFFDMYTYSFVNEELMKKCLLDVSNLVPIKNALSEELTHMRGSIIPNMLLSLEKNLKDYQTLKLFEVEKVFKYIKGNIIEDYSLVGVELFSEDIAYYKIQNTLSNFLKFVGIYDFSFDNSKSLPNYAHSGRTAGLIIRGQEVGIVGEIHPKAAKNFNIDKRIGFFEINVSLFKDMLYQSKKATDISSFQENNFDLNFVISKDTKSSKVKDTIKKLNNLITKIDLIDIYENESKLPGKRSITFKIYIQSHERTLDDKDKGELINLIIENVKKIGGELRS